MLNSLLGAMLKYPSYFSLGALVLSTFFAGTYLQGERVRKQEIQDELREIQQLTEQSNAQVEQIQTALEQEDARLVQEISEAYTALADLNEKELEVRSELEASERERARLEQVRRDRREEIRRSGEFFFNN